jgi:hypothetical protein
MPRRPAGNLLRYKQLRNSGFSCGSKKILKKRKGFGGKNLIKMHKNT